MVSSGVVKNNRGRTEVGNRYNRKLCSVFFDLCFNRGGCVRFFKRLKKIIKSKITLDRKHRVKLRVVEKVGKLEHIGAIKSNSFTANLVLLTNSSLIRQGRDPQYYIMVLRSVSGVGLGILPEVK